MFRSMQSAGRFELFRVQFISYIAPVNVKSATRSNVPSQDEDDTSPALSVTTIADVSDGWIFSLLSPSKSQYIVTFSRVSASHVFDEGLIPQVIVEHALTVRLPKSFSFSISAVPPVAFIIPHSRGPTGIVSVTLYVQVYVPSPLFVSLSQMP